MPASGHCVAFAQEINEPAQILPRLPSQIKIIKVRKKGRNDTSKECVVQRSKVLDALVYLKRNTPGYRDIIICEEHHNMLPIEGEIDVHTLEYDNESTSNDKGPAPEQGTEDDNDITEANSMSGVPLADHQLIYVKK